MKKTPSTYPEVLDRPLTPSFEPLTESEPWCGMEESLAFYRQN